MKVRLKVLTIVAIVLFIITLAENIFNIYCYFNDIRTPYSLTILSNLSMVALVFTFIILIIEDKKAKKLKKYSEEGK